MNIYIDYIIRKIYKSLIYYLKLIYNEIDFELTRMNQFWDLLSNVYDSTIAPASIGKCWIVRFSVLENHLCISIAYALPSDSSSKVWLDQGRVRKRRHLDVYFFERHPDADHEGRNRISTASVVPILCTSTIS